VKVGAFFDRRRRDYWTDSYATNPGTVNSPNWGLLSLPIEVIFAPENYGSRKYTFLEMNTYAGEYEATHDTDAYYGMVVHPFTVGGMRLRFAGGVRVEDSDQRSRTALGGSSGGYATSTIHTTDALPSANLTYSPAGWANLRLAYFHSVNRPELREMSDVLYYDFNESQDVIGNPDLKRALIRNYDVRFEAFPGIDEVFAVSYFHKDLEDAIEVALRPSAAYRSPRNISGGSMCSASPSSPAASVAAKARCGLASAPGMRPSPRTTAAAIAVIPPIDDPTSATRVTPRCPSHASAPATSSTSSRPNVVGPSSEPP
jgi:hypothetical protein